MITGSQQRLPIKAVSDVAAGFGAALGTSALATKAQACPYRKTKGSAEGGDDEMMHGRTRPVGVKDDIFSIMEATTNRKKRLLLFWGIQHVMHTHMDIS